MSKRMILPLLLVVAVVALLAAPFLGLQSVSLHSVIHPGQGGWAATLFWKMRVPRTLTGFLAGSCLALSGLAFQSLFRNPLATPFTLGVSSGASFGAVFVIRFGLVYSVAGLSTTALAAFVGAVACIALVYALVRGTGTFTTARLLLAGVAVSFFFSSLIMFIHYTADFQDVFRLMRWLMGGLAGASYDGVCSLLPFALGGLVLLWFLSHELNLLATGDEIALSRGVEAERMRNVILFCTSLMEGGVVAVCGPIGFVGIMAPHACRLLLGGNHRALVPAAFLLGGTFLVVCDTLARIVAKPAEVPVGVITALLGGPFFLWLLLSGSAEDIEL